MCEILAAASTDLEHTTLESANGIKTTWLLLPCPLPIVQSGGVCGEARRNRHASSFDSYDLWRNLQEGINGGQTARASFFACPLVIAKVRKKVDTNWGQPLISHTRAKLTFGSSALVMPQQCASKQVLQRWLFLGTETLWGTPMGCRAIRRDVDG